MDDLISRQAAIDVIRKCSIKEVTPAYMLIDKAEAMTEVMLLPSAQPEADQVARDMATIIENEKDMRVIQKNAEQQWVPVTERLPEVCGRYLVTRGLKACDALWNRVYIINYSDLMGLKSERIWWKGNVGKSDFERIDDVIAWMPLVEPYEGE